GEGDYQKIDDDLDRLTAYYRSLGYFRAKIGRELVFDDDRQWATLRFVINDGPRYRIRNVSFMGNQIFSEQEFREAVQLREGEYFDQKLMNQDLAFLRDKYGGQGFVFADVQADPRFLEEPGQLDLVYRIEE